jgi:hypothetical protein
MNDENANIVELIARLFIFFRHGKREAKPKKALKPPTIEEFSATAFSLSTSYDAVQQ